MTSYIGQKPRVGSNISGGAILPIYDELYRAEAQGGIQHILVRHEQGASHAADGYARATGQVGDGSS
ncbi:thiamine pyrophosphate-binding protein [Sodalinema gerasimenkoae]|uniref:thiamine pyrophosphate-binding protein n=1 Tax=Sodalinema gerasimenkoae TaxID=2862348 RepID=UPI003CCDAD69